MLEFDPREIEAGGVLAGVGVAFQSVDLAVFDPQQKTHPIIQPVHHRPDVSDRRAQVGETFVGIDVERREKAGAGVFTGDDARPSYLPRERGGASGGSNGYRA